MRIFIEFLKKSENLSALSIRLVYLTRKAKVPIHPKHLIKKKEPWFKNYLSRNDSLLDLGCGTGTDMIKAAKIVRTAIGIDIDKRSLEIAQKLAKKAKQNNVKFLHVDLNKKLPFKDNSFHKIICSDVLEHLKRRDIALKEIVRLLKSNGVLLLVTDNPDTSWKKLLKKNGLFFYADHDHKYEYPIDEIISKLEAINFEIKSISSVTYDTPLKGFIDLTGGISLTVYKYLSKWKQKMLKKYPQDTAGYKIVAQISK